MGVSVSAPSLHRVYRLSDKRCSQSRKMLTISDARKMLTILENTHISKNAHNLVKCGNIILGKCCHIHRHSRQMLTISENAHISIRMLMILENAHNGYKSVYNAHNLVISIYRNVHILEKCSHIHKNVQNLGKCSHICI